MNKADKYFIDTLNQLKRSQNFDENPRPKYKDGTPAFTRFVTQKTFDYDISKGEFPINTLRPTAVKGGWYDMEAIYIKQTNVVEEMHPSIHSWWVDFIVKDGNIGQTYGHTVKRYNLVDTLLKGLETNPFGRRHMINLWQEQQIQEDPKALVPCCYETLWSVRQEEIKGHIVDLSENKFEPVSVKTRYVDLTMNQRSMDYMMTSSINPTQYVMLGMAVCGHLTQATGIKHSLGMFHHLVQNLHIYDRHMDAVYELLDRVPKEEAPHIELLANKNFYDYTIDDFKITLPTGIEKLSKPLELAI